MKKNLIILFALILCLPGFIFSDLVSFKVGYYIPRAMSDLWEEEFINMNFIKTDFHNTNFIFGYEYFVSREFSIVLGVESYTRNKSGVYNDYVGEDIDNQGYAFDYGEGYPISHVFTVSSTPIQAAIKLTPLGRKGKIIPYIGGGFSAYLWSVRLQGDMIDFAAGEEFIDLDNDAIVIGYPTYPVDAREENKISFGFHVFGGVMLPIANRISLEGEVKYSKASGTLKEAFIGFEPFDLSGLTISIGMNYWF
ncbi:hypothetical protein ACFLQZ_04945 [Acidobacteriota bacterium]